ncbi:MAG: response regulator [Chitinophagales bacterium]|jgi:DNA-binding NtrC family response regulator|nr:response regulator [Chitinophagales bacterium]
MDKSTTQIIWIDDDIKFKDDVLMDELRETYQTVSFFDKAAEGLQYIFNNTNQAIIIILDIDMPKMNGHVFLSKLREVSKLIPVILFTGINENTEVLSDFINNHAFAFIKKDAGYEEIMAIVKKAETELLTRADGLIEDALEEWLLIQDKQKLDKPYLVQAGGQSYSINQILQEVRQQTPFGRTFMKDVVMLTIDLILRNKRQLS